MKPRKIMRLRWTAIALLLCAVLLSCRFLVPSQPTPVQETVFVPMSPSQDQKPPANEAAAAAEPAAVVTEAEPGPGCPLAAVPLMHAGITTNPCRHVAGRGRLRRTAHSRDSRDFMLNYWQENQTYGRSTSQD